MPQSQRKMARLQSSRAEEADPISRNKAIGDKHWWGILGKGRSPAWSDSYSNRFRIAGREQHHGQTEPRVQVSEAVADTPMCFSTWEVLRGACPADQVRLLVFVPRHTRHRHIGEPSPTTDMNMQNQNRKHVTKQVATGLDFGPKPNPWDLEFPDSPGTAFRLWALKYFGRHFHEESVRKMELSMDGRRNSLG